MAKKKSITQQEREAFEIQDLRERGALSEPTIFYKVGDRVQRGNIKLAHVTEVLDGGKILRLHETCTNENYGKPYDYERDSYVRWYDVEPWKDFSKEKPIHNKDRHRMHYYQTMLYSLIKRHHNFTVDFDPEYQRGIVWGPADKAALIDSIFQEVDIGKFVFRHLPYKPAPAPSYEIVDGKQRLLTLIEFYEGRFKWRGKLFRDLHPGDRGFIINYPVSVADLHEDTTREQVLEVFVRLNTSGRPMDPKHLESVKRMLNTENDK